MTESLKQAAWVLPIPAWVRLSVLGFVAVRSPSHLRSSNFFSKFCMVQPVLLLWEIFVNNGAGQLRPSSLFVWMLWFGNPAVLLLTLISYFFALRWSRRVWVHVLVRAAGQMACQSKIAQVLTPSRSLLSNSPPQGQCRRGLAYQLRCFSPEKRNRSRV